MLLHTKCTLSLLTKEDYQIHEKECKQVENAIVLIPNYDCYAILCYYDVHGICHEDKRVDGFKLHDYYKLLDNVYISDGIDYIISDGVFGIICYGKYIKINDISQYSRTYISIFPYDKNNNIISITSNILKNVDIDLYDDKYHDIYSLSEKERHSF